MVLLVYRIKLVNFEHKPRGFHRFASAGLFVVSLGLVYEFVCISFRTDNLNCFRVK